MSRFVLTAQMRLRAPDNVAQVRSQIQRQLNGINVPITATGSRTTTRSVDNVRTSIDRTTDSTDRMSRAFRLYTVRFGAFGLASRVLTGLISGLSAGITSAINFEREINKVGQVTGQTSRQLEGLTETITDLAVGIGTSSEDLATSARSLSQAGFAAGELDTALTALAKTTVAPTFSDIGKTTEGVIAIFNQFGQGAGAIEGQLASINAIAGKFAVESDDLIDSVRRAGAVFKSAGSDADELFALFTAVRSTTRLTAESIGTGFKTIFSRIQNPATLDFLEQFGVKLRDDLTGNFVGAFKAVQELNRVFGNLPAGDTTLTRVAKEVGGLRQIDKLIPLIQNVEVAERALQVARADGIDLDSDVERSQEALAVQIEQVRQEYLALVRDLTNTVVFNTLIKVGLNLASVFLKVADSLKEIIPIVGVLGGLAIGRAGFNFASGFFGRNAGGRVPVFHDGGFVSGVGNSDDVPAILQEGEYVIKKSSVKQIGLQTLQALNDNRFNTGGPVQDMTDFTEFLKSGGSGKEPFVSPGMGKGKEVLAKITPGEFVFNAKSAEKIGLARLNRMNREGVATFNRGGAVGGVRRFQNGGAVAAGGGVLAGLTETISTSIDGLTSSFNEIKDTVTDVFGGLSSGALLATAQIFALSKALKAGEQSQKKQISVIDRITNRNKKLELESARLSQEYQELVQTAGKIGPRQKELENLMARNNKARQETGRLLKANNGVIKQSTRAILNNVRANQAGAAVARTGVIGKVSAGFGVVRGKLDTLGKTVGRFSDQLFKAGVAAALVAQGLNFVSDRLGKNADEAAESGDLASTISNSNNSALLGRLGTALTTGLSVGAGAGLATANPFIGVGAGAIAGIASFALGSDGTEELDTRLNALASGALTRADVALRKLGDNDAPALSESILSAVNEIKAAEQAVAEIDSKKAREEAEGKIADAFKNVAVTVGQSAKSQEEFNKATKLLTEEQKKVAQSARDVVLAQNAISKAVFDAAKINSVFSRAQTAAQNLANAFETGATQVGSALNTLQTAATTLGDSASGERAVTALRNAANTFFAERGISGSSTQDSVNRSLDAANTAVLFNARLQERLGAADLPDSNNQRQQAIRNIINQVANDIGDSDLGNTISTTVNELFSKEEGADINKVIKEVGDVLTTVIKPATDFGKALEDRTKLLNDLTKRRIAAEQRFIKAQETAIDRQFEAARIIQEAGGGRLSLQRGLQGRNAQFNLRAADAGIRGVGSGSPAEIRAVGEEIRRSFRDLESEAGRRAINEGRGLGIDEDRRGALRTASESLVKLSKDRINLLKEELGVVKQRLSLERDSVQSLLAGDVQGFIEKQSQAAAANAIRSGNSAALRAFSASDIAGAVQNLRQDPSVTPRDLEKALTSSGVLQGIGLGRREAQLIAGTTVEEERINSQIRQTAAAFADVANISAALENMSVQANQVIINAAEVTSNTGIVDGVNRQSSADAGAFLQAANGAANNLNQAAEKLNNTKLDLKVEPIEVIVRTPSLERNIDDRVREIAEEVVDRGLASVTIGPNGRPRRSRGVLPS